MVEPPSRKIHWARAWRLVPTRIPRINLYERLADSHEQRRLAEIEELTNPRMMEERGTKNFLRKGDYFRKNVSPGVKASFAYLAPSRFGSGIFPILYAASNELTALAEKRHHLARFLKAHHTRPTISKQIAWILSVSGKFHDLRQPSKNFKNFYSLNSYTAAQSLGRHLWEEGSQGIVYESVRRPSGQCVAAFSPQTIMSCSRGPLFEFHWDGNSIKETFRLESRQDK